MNVMQVMVEEFHRAMAQPHGGTPEIRNGELRISLIEEEVRETIEAIRRGDLVAAVDGLCDTLYVVFGTAVAFGVDLAPVFGEVHESNMRKTTGPVREDGKRLKPPGWQPPDVKGLLIRQGASL